MKIIIIHNLLWTHYRNKIFSELYHQAIQANDNPPIQIKVLQFARNERSRANMEGMDKMSLDYDYDLLFDGFWEDVSSVDLFKKLIKKIDEFRPDVVNLIGYYTWVQILTLLYCRLKGIKIVLSNDSTALDNVKVLWKTLLKRFLVSLCSGFFNFGSLATQYMKSLGGKDSQMLANRCASVDNDFIEKAHQAYLPTQESLRREFAVSPKNFIFVGRFIEIKNLFCLLEAFDKAKKATNDSSTWGLILLGDGILKEKLQDFVAEKSITDVHFVAGKAWYEIPKFLAMADVFVLPSASEPWGLVVNEAMICQMPVIVSDKCGCAADLVKPNQNGYVFPFESAEQLSLYMQKFINQEVDREKMGQISGDIIKDFTPQKVAHAMLNGFRSLKKN